MLTSGVPFLQTPGVNWEKWEIINTDKWLMLINKQYINTKVRGNKLRLLSDPPLVWRKVRQGCILLPFLFLIFIKTVVKNLRYVIWHHDCLCWQGKTYKSSCVLIMLCFCYILKRVLRGSWGIFCRTVEKICKQMIKR